MSFFCYTTVEDSESLEDKPAAAAGKEDDDEEDESNLYFSADTIKNVLKHLAQGFKMEVVSLFFKTKDRVQKILLHLNQRLATAHRRQVPPRPPLPLPLLLASLQSLAFSAAVALVFTDDTCSCTCIVVLSGSIADVPGVQVLC
jgi:hypothetical protein